LIIQKKDNPTRLGFFVPEIHSIEEEV